MGQVSRRSEGSVKALASLRRDLVSKRDRGDTNKARKKEGNEKQSYRETNKVETRLKKKGGQESYRVPKEKYNERESRRKEENEKQETWDGNANQEERKRMKG